MTPSTDLVGICATFGGGAGNSKRFLPGLMGPTSTESSVWSNLSSVAEPTYTIFHSRSWAKSRCASKVISNLKGSANVASGSTTLTPSTSTTDIVWVGVRCVPMALKSNAIDNLLQPGDGGK